MHTNEFEKEVQKKMEELKLPPSDAVWLNVQARIKKEKHRRWILVFLPILLSCIAFGGYVLFNPSDSNKKQLPKNLEEITINKEPSNHLDSTGHAQIVADYKKALSKAVSGKKSEQKKAKTPTGSERSESYHLNKSLLRKVSDDSNKEFYTAPNIVEKRISIIYNKDTTPEKTIAGEEHKPDLTETDRHDPLIQSEVRLLKDTLEKKIEDLISIRTKNIAPVNKHLWSWGVNFSIGSSGLANGLLGSGQKSFSVADLTSSGNQINAPYHVPSVIKSSIGLIAGFSVEKNISPNITLATGLNYELFSTTNKVGTDTATYFRFSNDLISHHNFYHYIALPIGLKMQIARLNKTRLYWDIEFSISQLLNSNALQFNRIAGLYYHDNSQLNKTQIRFNTGPGIALFLKQNKSLLIGPYLGYSLSKAAAQGYNKHHFTFIGLRTQIMFTKK